MFNCYYADRSPTNSINPSMLQHKITCIAQQTQGEERERQRERKNEEKKHTQFIEMHIYIK